MKVLFLNPQGNFDDKDSHWTQHPDFGGQLVYVKETALAMAKKGVKVDIVTRLIEDEGWKEFADEIEHYQGSDVRIVRIPFGGKKFLRKELLWPHLYEYVKGIQSFYKKAQGYPDFITSHYGDGGLAAAMFREEKKVPYSFTAHSLGAQKMQKLRINKENFQYYEERLHFSKRITAEKIAMANASTYIVSTRQEQIEQYGHPLYQDVVHIHSSKFKVVPPGVNTKIFQPKTENQQEDAVKERLKKVIQRDIAEERKKLPFVIASSRLDKKKNHLTLVNAFGKKINLRKKANLLIVIGGVENPYHDYSKLKEEEQKILDEIMNSIKINQLKGKVAFISLNNQKELAACYRQVAEKGGLFSLTALFEPFGLAPIEAMACGLPVVVTKNGGPLEVLKEGDTSYGLLVDPEDEEDIAEKITAVLSNKERWQYYQKQGILRVREKYTWERTAEGYIASIEEILKTGDKGENRGIPSYYKGYSHFLEKDVQQMKEAYLST
ncbi:sucrose-phosphate synthase [Natronincola peptidivorans]|uniref:sucrose-phosphate synthase n=1 Tax=Natronincola peptidivorans TaxID=426128 RepID=A0A1I0A5F8_9FIRM|nr:glycosyltransferase [Natronincola peptidivorans]SES89402.1 sucrose-phosphate synthase [Natronincola peptidivorans]